MSMLFLLLACDSGDGRAQWLEQPQGNWITHPPSAFVEQLVGRDVVRACEAALEDGAEQCVGRTGCVHFTYYIGGEVKLSWSPNRCEVGAVSELRRFEPGDAAGTPLLAP